MTDQLPVSVDALDDIPEAARGFYVDRSTLPETDPRSRAAGAFVVNIGDERHEGWNVSNFQSLHSALGRQTEEARSLRERLKPFDGLSPDEVDRWRSVYDERKDWSKPGTNLEQAREEIQREFSDRLRQTEEGRRSEAQRARDAVLDATILRAAARAGVDLERFDVFLPYMRQEVFEVVEVDGSEQIRGRGDLRFARDGDPGNYAGVDEIFARLRDDKRFGEMFNGHGVAGSGGNGSSGPRDSGGTHSGPNPFHKDTASLLVATEMERTNPTLAERLKQDAGANLHPAFVD